MIHKLLITPLSPGDLWCTSASIAAFSLYVCCVIACTAASSAPMACSVALAELASDSSRFADTAGKHRCEYESSV